MSCLLQKIHLRIPGFTTGIGGPQRAITQECSGFGSVSRSAHVPHRIFVGKLIGLASLWLDFYLFSSEFCLFQAKKHIEFDA